MAQNSVNSDGSNNTFQQQLFAGVHTELEYGI